MKVVFFPIQPDPHRTPTPRFVRWDSGLPIRCDLLVRLPFGHLPLPFVRLPPGGYINFWRCYERSQAFLRSRHAAIYDEHSLSELLMTAFKTYKPTLLLAACFLSNGVQASTCITAGRMDNAVWAPQFQSVRLLDDAGRNLTVKNKSELKQVRAVELTEAALLSICDGNKPVDRSDGVMSKGPVPAAKPGRFNVAGLSFPKLRSGELVEFEVTIAADQIVMISR